VAYVLEGSIRKSGEHLRVRAQLIDSRDGTHLFLQTYDRDLVDVLKMQDEIATSLVRVLQAAIRFQRLRVVGQLISASLYLIWRFGAGTLRHGLTTGIRMKWLGASAFHAEWIFLTLDVIVPVLMTAAIALSLQRVVLSTSFGGEKSA